MRTPLLAFLLISAAAGQVSFDRIRKAGAEPGNWLTYSGNYSGHRFSPLAQITTANATWLAWHCRASADPVHGTGSCRWRGKPAATRSFSGSA